jgi:hypothetical protein
MRSAAEFAQERTELQSVLDSGLFDRAPSLAQLLTYICSRYFDGEGEQIKEYNIAVEALGRPPDFDPKRDSIVRVEAYRLRKRLRDYYASEGIQHAVHIVVPPGHYTPKFLVRQELAPANNSGAAHVRVETVPQVRPDIPLEFAVVLPWYHNLWWLLTLLLALGVVIAGVFWPRSKPEIQPSAAAISMAAVTMDEIRILAGNETGGYFDGFGRHWQSDRFFTGGSVFRAHDHPILGSRDPGIYQSRREGSFSYDVPLKPGTYELRLHFAETLYGEGNTAGGGEASRVFNVTVNGHEALHDLDVTAEVGPSSADIKVLKDISPAADGKLHLRFDGSTGVAFLNAIEITPGLPGLLRPIRMVARDRGLTDSEGRYWEPDRLARGGQLVVRSRTASLTPHPELYQGERFGNLTYSIPVSPGRYRLTLYFAETWFGPDKPGHGGSGSRVFDILCNGVVLARGFDVYREAGGSGRAIARAFQNLRPNPQGNLVISLTPVTNYACVNALEVSEERQ